MEVTGVEMRVIAGAYRFAEGMGMDLDTYMVH